jgi:hypothetical protein
MLLKENKKYNTLLLLTFIRLFFILVTINIIEEGILLKIKVVYNENGKTFQEIMEFFLLQICDKNWDEYVEKYV